MTEVEMAEQSGSIVNPAHPVPNEVADGLRNFREEEFAELNLRNEFAKQSRPTEDERRSITELYDQAAQGLGVDLEKLRRVHREISENRAARVQEAAKRVAPMRRELVPLDLEPPPPGTARADHSFWWADTSWVGNSGGMGTVDVRFEPDGAHAHIHLFTKSGDLRFAHLHLVAAFELQANRVPHSVTGLWRSAPFIELFGGITGFTSPSGGGLAFAGDSWCKCWMHLGHRILQFLPGGTFPVIVADANETRTLLHEEDQGRWVPVSMPGFVPMPQLRFGSFRRDISLWAHLGIRFDIQMEGGPVAELSVTPDVLIRTFQWALEPHA